MTEIIIGRKLAMEIIQLMYLVSNDYGYVMLNIVLNNAAWEKLTPAH